jgi:hypothetical protein
MAVEEHHFHLSQCPIFRDRLRLHTSRKYTHKAALVSDRFFLHQLRVPLPILGERHANNILWISTSDMILMSWDATEKKTYRDGGMLYRSKQATARVWQSFVASTGCGSGSCTSGGSACVVPKRRRLLQSKFYRRKYRYNLNHTACNLLTSSFVIAAAGA